MVLNAIFKAKATATCVPENRLERGRQAVRDRERKVRESSTHTIGHGVRGSDGAFSDLDFAALASNHSL